MKNLYQSTLETEKERIKNKIMEMENKAKLNSYQNDEVITEVINHISDSIATEMAEENKDRIEYVSVKEATKEYVTDMLILILEKHLSRTKIENVEQGLKIFSDKLEELPREELVEISKQLNSIVVYKEENKMSVLEKCKVYAPKGDRVVKREAPVVKSAKLKIEEVEEKSVRARLVDMKDIPAVSFASHNTRRREF